MATSNEPVTTYVTNPSDQPIRVWSQDDLDAFLVGWESLNDERRSHSIAQPPLYVQTPTGILNVRNNQYIETFPEVVKEPEKESIRGWISLRAESTKEPEPDPEEIAKRTEARTKGSKRADAPNATGRVR